MGYKSRSNWLVGICLRYDCLNQDEEKICKKCIGNSFYEKFKKLDAVAEDKCKITEQT